VGFVNYDTAIIIGKYCLDVINFIAGRGDFYVVGGRGVAVGMGLSFYAFPLCFYIVSLSSIVAYFLRKRFCVSLLVALLGFGIYCILFPYFKLYFFILYCIAFSLALCEIKLLYALQDYMRTKRDK